MTDQLTMFGPSKPRTRMIDKRTGLPTNVLSAQQAAVLEAVAAHRDGTNAWGVQQWLRDRGRHAPETNAVGSRFAEIEEVGWVRQVKDAPGPTGRPQHSFTATASGITRLCAYLDEETL